MSVPKSVANDATFITFLHNPNNSRSQNGVHRVVRRAFTPDDTSIDRDEKVFAFSVCVVGFVVTFLAGIVFSTALRKYFARSVFLGLCTLVVSLVFLVGALVYYRYRTARHVKYIIFFVPFYYCWAHWFAHGCQGILLSGYTGFRPGLVGLCLLLLICRRSNLIRAYCLLFGLQLLLLHILEWQRVRIRWFVPPEPSYTQLYITFPVGNFVMDAVIVQTLWTMINRLRHQQDTLLWEKQLSDRLLYNTLPRPIAKELLRQLRADSAPWEQVDSQMTTQYRNPIPSRSQTSDSRSAVSVSLQHTLAVQRGPIAHSHEMATITFADIVGFTSMCNKSPAETLVALLNRIVQELDQAAAECKVEKIKTIGDAYMAAAIPAAVEQSGGACESILSFTIRMHATISEFTLTDKPMEMRIGVHAGPVVSGVIGLTKFSYDLWGDTVNLASRMESTGVPGRTQVTDAVVGLARGGNFEFQPRGKVTVKGIGQVECHLLVTNSQTHRPSRVSRNSRTSRNSAAPSAGEQNGNNASPTNNNNNDQTWLPWLQSNNHEKVASPTGGNKLHLMEVLDRVTQEDTEDRDTVSPMPRVLPSFQDAISECDDNDLPPRRSSALGASVVLPPAVPLSPSDAAAVPRPVSPQFDSWKNDLDRLHRPVPVVAVSSSSSDD